MNTLTRGFLPLLGRLLVACIFATSAYSKAFGWAGNMEYMQMKHMPLPGLLLAAALLVEVVGSLCLLSGFMARPAAVVVFLYMVPVTVLLHDFMSTQFQKNLGIMGGLLMIACFGPGTWALSRRKLPAGATPEKGTTA